MSHVSFSSVRDSQSLFFIQQEISRCLRPKTLRALYGKDKVKNAVHCTDLPEDGVLEVGAATDTHTREIHFIISSVQSL